MVTKPKTIQIIGLGGIGSRLAPDVAQHLSYLGDLKDVELVLVDGDKYEAKNAVRQIVSGLTNKAEATQALLEESFPSLKIKAQKAFLGEKSGFTEGRMVLAISKVITEGSWVFGCVDNNKTRLLISKHVQTLQNVVYIDGGNEKTDGSVQVYIRQDGKDLTPPIETYQPGIADPQDKAPFELSCEALVQSGEIQLLATNATVANIMYLTMWRLLESTELPEAIAATGYFDITRVFQDGSVASFVYYPVQEKKDIANGNKEVNKSTGKSD